jgi:hypothetical protein
MLEIIQEWRLDPEEEEPWRNAATQFRLPYWDWARKQEYSQNFAIPIVCTLETIDIIVPGGKTIQVANPLVGFQNPMVNSKGEHVVMGDPSMKENAIKNDPILPPPPGTETLPVST